VLNLLSQLQRDFLQTFVMVSHDLAVVAHICDHIAVMVSGQFVEFLTRVDLIAGKVASAEARHLFSATGHKL
jgi:peptide/nickel transport system ATP-binding protein